MFIYLNINSHVDLVMNVLKYIFQYFDILSIHKFDTRILGIQNHFQDKAILKSNFRNISRDVQPFNSASVPPSYEIS